MRFFFVGMAVVAALLSACAVGSPKEPARPDFVATLGDERATESRFYQAAEDEAVLRIRAARAKRNREFHGFFARMQADIAYAAEEKSVAEDVSARRRNAEFWEVERRTQRGVLENARAELRRFSGRVRF